MDGERMRHLVAMGLSEVLIAREMCCTPQNVANWKKKHLCKEDRTENLMRMGENEMARNREESDARRRRIVELSMQGVSGRQVAEAVGVSAAYVSRVVSEHREETGDTLPRADKAVEAEAAEAQDAVPAAEEAPRSTEEDVYRAGYNRGRMEAAGGIRREAVERGAAVLRQLMLHTLDVLRCGGSISPEVAADWTRMEAFRMIADALGFQDGDRYLEEVCFTVMGGEKEA